MKHKYKILFALSLIALAASIMLSFQSTEQVFCSVGSGCDIVHASPYNYTFGIQNSYFGIAIFGILSILLYTQIKSHKRVKRKLINVSVLIGSLIVFYFLYIQAFVLHAYCKYCLIVDTSMVAALVITLIGWRD